MFNNKTVESLCRFFNAYGGFSSILKSGFFYISLFLSIFTLITTSNIKYIDFDFVKNTIPSILGFSIGSFAIVIGFGSEKFRKIISGKRDYEIDSPFIRISASFLYFILIQVLCLISVSVYDLLIIYQQNEDFIQLKRLIFLVQFFVIFSFWYSINLSFATGLFIFQMATYFDDYVRIERDRESSDNSNK